VQGGTRWSRTWTCTGSGSRPTLLLWELYFLYRGEPADPHLGSGSRPTLLPISCAGGNPLIPNMNLYGFGIPAHLIPGLNPLMGPGFLGGRGSLPSGTDDIAADDDELGGWQKLRAKISTVIIHYVLCICITGYVLCIMYMYYRFAAETLKSWINAAKTDNI
jgi:hypothetical protein